MSDTITLLVYVIYASASEKMMFAVTIPEHDQFRTKHFEVNKAAVHEYLCKHWHCEFERILIVKELTNHVEIEVQP